MTKDVPFSERKDRATVELGESFAPKFDANGLIPAIVQDVQTGDVLMLAYMNESSLRETLRLGEAVYWSRSRQKFWHKGETSGHVQKVREILVDCDQDALVLRVEQMGGACCHNGYRRCFYRALNDEGHGLRFVEREKAFDPESVYGR